MPWGTRQPLQFNYNINIAKANKIGNCDMIKLVSARF